MMCICQTLTGVRGTLAPPHLQDWVDWPAGLEPDEVLRLSETVDRSTVISLQRAFSLLLVYKVFPVSTHRSTLTINWYCMHSIVRSSTFMYCLKIVFLAVSFDV